MFVKMFCLQMFAIFVSIIALFVGLTEGADFFEAVLIRPNCYPDVQPGCKNNEFIDAYPELAWSYQNLTKATTYFYLFTRDNPDIPELLHKCGGNLPPDTKFNPKCRTEIYLPGFVSGICNYAIFRELKDERLKSGCYNVILLDWMWGNTFDLVVAFSNMKIVAKQLKIVIKKLKEKFGLTKADFILTGHSYGAHMAGFVGQIEPIGIINGIEPSGGLTTQSTPEDDRLDAGDADCVQVLHTNAGQCIPQYFGVNFTCGTFDVFFNDGLKQPACVPQTFKSFLKGDLIYGFFSLLPAACSHFQALQYYKASMNPDGCALTAVECDSLEDFNAGKCKCERCARKCLNVGAYGCDCFRGDTHKNYYVKTTIDCPFCDKKNAMKNANKAYCGSKPPGNDTYFYDCKRKKQKKAI